jgi:hypothetical protein
VSGITGDTPGSTGQDRRSTVRSWTEEGPHMREDPPNGLPHYRILTGPDDESFCRRVSEALALGYRLHGSPAIAVNGNEVVAAQAVLWASRAERSGDSLR